MYDPRQNPRAQLSTVENLCSFSIPMMRQPWQRVYVKDTDKGPMVWEIKHAPIWLSRDGSILGPYWLIYARNLLDPGEVKYFLSNASPGTPLESIVHVAFARWPVERTLEDEKDELGLSHFEVRKYHSIMRHLSVTQVSHLFLARQTERLRGEKPGDHVVSGPDRCERASRCAASAEASPHGATRKGVVQSSPNSRSEPACPKVAHEDEAIATKANGDSPRRFGLLHSPIIHQVALSYWSVADQTSAQ